MKVYKKKFAHRNILVFLFLSVIYLRVVYAFSHGVSFFLQSNFIAFLINNLVVLFLLPVAIYSVFKFEKYAKILLIVFFTIIVITSFVLLSTSFNKLVLALNFAYVLFAFYFFTMWEIERDEAGYNPLFAQNDLEKQTRFNVEGRLFSEDKSHSEKVYLTNIDENSCYVLLDTGHFNAKVAILEFELDGIAFSSKVNRISSYDQGLGFYFQDAKNSPWSLTELCKICRQRGMFLV